MVGRTGCASRYGTTVRGSVFRSRATQEEHPCFSRWPIDPSAVCVGHHILTVMIARDFKTEEGWVNGTLALFVVLCCFVSPSYDHYQ
jgi:hypothetical protein